MILMSVFESIKRECFPFPRELVMGHYSVGDAGRDNYEYVRKMVKRLLNAELQINIKKCEFEAIKTKYLKIIITPEGIEINFAKIQTILE
jgi:hypothetical protein